MQPSVTGAQFQQLSSTLLRVKTAILNFTALIDSLHSFLETVYDLVGARKKRDASKVVLLALGWGKNEDKAIHCC